MKTQPILCALCLAALLLNASVNSQQVAVDRYTILGGGLIEYDSGNLLDSGQFRVLGSETFEDDPFWYEAVDGRPLLLDAEYEADKAGGLIPNWARSAADFYNIGLLPYVIVAVKGKGDPNPAITIGLQPQSVDVPLGGTASFLVGADPVGYLSYQWEFKGRGGLKPIPGATGSLYEIDGATAADAGQYVAELSTGGKAVASQAAVLRVIPPVAIVKEPQPVVVRSGGPAKLSVSVQGPASAYQWYFDGSLIAGATNATYTVKKAGAGNVGSYSVLVIGEFNRQLSASASLSLKP